MTTLVDLCGTHGSCVFLPSSGSHCQCSHGWTGKFCDTRKWTSIDIRLTGTPCTRHGHIFPVGGVATSGWGGGYISPQLPKSSPVASKKKKKGRRFLRKVFYYVEKIAIPPQTVLAGGMEVLGGGVYTPHTPPPPHAHVCPIPSVVGL